MFDDNFNGRSVIRADEDQSQVSTYSFYIDAFMTLEYLSKDPRVNIKKVGITGWSRGAMNSLAIAESRIRDALITFLPLKLSTNITAIPFFSNCFATSLLNLNHSL